MTIAKAMDVEYEQVFILPNGKKIGIELKG